jgi:hypothetical protein
MKITTSLLLRRVERIAGRRPPERSDRRTWADIVREIRAMGPEAFVRQPPPDPLAEAIAMLPQPVGLKPKIVCPG